MQLCQICPKDETYGHVVSPINTRVGNLHLAKNDTRIQSMAART